MDDTFDCFIRTCIKKAMNHMALLPMARTKNNGGPSPPIGSGELTATSMPIALHGAVHKSLKAGRIVLQIVSRTPAEKRAEPP
jgi:hypothetical protein